MLENKDIMVGCKYRAVFIKNLYVEVVKVSNEKVWFNSLSSGVRWKYPIYKFKIEFVKEN